MNATIKHAATQQQADFILSAQRVSAFVGGVGSGKTRASVLKALKMPAGSIGMLISPTFTMLKDSLLRTYLEIAKDVTTSFNQSDLHARLLNGSEILFRSADNPDRLRGPNLGWAGLDEAALMDREALDIMLGRLRLVPGKLWFTTTPKGRNHWLFDYVTNGNAHLVRARSLDNPFLPQEYLDELKRQYAADFYRQEVMGEFIERGGRVFRDPTYYDTLPDTGYREAHGFDAAYTSATRADYSVTITGRLYGDHLYITNVIRDQLEAGRYLAKIKAQGIDKVHWFRSGTEKGLEAFLKNEGIKVIATPAVSDKFVRAQPAAAAWNTGKILVPRHGEWVGDLLDEVLVFTGVDDAHDDQVDALASLHDALARPAPRPHPAARTTSYVGTQ